MSRSIHTTRHSIKKLWAKDFATSKEKSQAVQRELKKLDRKRRIKRQVLSQRKHSKPPLVGTPVSTIPIISFNENAYVHHAASIANIRAILGLLPDGATEGIYEIQLLLGDRYMEEVNDEAAPERDPYTGRISHRPFPGVYSGPVLGTYHYNTGLIQIYAYVYDQNRIPLPLPICELYLRLHALKTLVHEVAHHHDRTKRVKRGRWLADRKANRESYAEKMEHQWTQEIVVPYLAQAYPKECSALRKWVAHRGGVLLPISFFAGDHRHTRRDGLQRLFWSTSGAFESWVEEFPGCSSLAESRLAFAKELHLADQYELCLQVLQRVLDQNPQHCGALVCRADTLVHLERYQEALVLADQILAVQPHASEAWEVRADVSEAFEDWGKLLVICDQWQQACPKDRQAELCRCQYRAVAYCALGAQEQMEKCIQMWVHFGKRTRNEKFIRRRVYRRAGKPEPSTIAPSAKP